MDFKNFIANAWAGLADLGTPKFPRPALNIPTKTIAGKITTIYYTQNPISICLENGAVWQVTKEQWEYLCSIGKRPKQGQNVLLDTYLDGTLKAVSLS